MTPEVANYLRATRKQIAASDNAEIALVEEALTNLQVPTLVIKGVRTIVGKEDALPIPCGADAAARRLLATRWAGRTLAIYNGDEEHAYASFTIANRSWRCVAHRPCLPLVAMITDVIRPLKKRRLDVAFAPTMNVAKHDGVILLEPALRVFLVKNELKDEDLAFINCLRQRLDVNAAEGSFQRSVSAPLTYEIVIDELMHLVELSPHRQSAAVAQEPSVGAKKGALLRMMVDATIPFRHIAGAEGLMKKPLKGALGDCKAARKNKELTPAIASNEIYPLLSEIPLTLNRQPARLPFCTLE